MSRLARLMIVSMIAVIAGSGLAGDAVPESARGPWLLNLPTVHVAEAEEFDWQTIFPNGDFEDEAYAPDDPPANHTFASGLSSWTTTGTVTVESGGPTGNYALLQDGASITSSAINVEDQGFQSNFLYFTFAVVDGWPGCVQI